MMAQHIVSPCGDNRKGRGGAQDSERLSWTVRNISLSLVCAHEMSSIVPVLIMDLGTMFDAWLNRNMTIKNRVLAEDSGR